MYSKIAQGCTVRLADGRNSHRDQAVGHASARFERSRSGLKSARSRVQNVRQVLRRQAFATRHARLE